MKEIIANIPKNLRVLCKVLEGEEEENTDYNQLKEERNEANQKKYNTRLKSVMKPTKESKKHLANLKNILQYSNATLFRDKDSDGYKCNFCKKKYVLPKDLKTHFLQKHKDFENIKLPRVFQYVLKMDITELRCKICDKTFDKLDDFTDHLQKEHKKTIYTDIRNQMIPFKFNSDALRCAICGTEFTNYKILLEHMHVHYRNFVCDICNSGFVTKLLLVRHKRLHKIDNIKCSDCEKIFNCDQKRKDHVKRVHMGLKKKHKCHLCQETFTDYWTKMNHLIKEHGAPPIVLKCQACERSFSNKRALTRHVKEDHLMERKHVCSICDMRFFLKGKMEDHMAMHTGDKRFQCPVCSSCYMTKRSLGQHQLRSHGDDLKSESRK